jgi:hypothetical protein
VAVAAGLVIVTAAMATLGSAGPAAASSVGSGEV